MRLKDVASVTIRPEPTAIIHDDVARSMDVTASVTGDPADVTAAVRAALATVAMPYEYHAEVLGNAAIRQDNDLRGLAYGGVALVGVFLLLQAAVGRWRRAGLALVSLPLSAAGGALTALIAGGAWSAASLTGLFAVLALAVRASMLLGRRVLAAEGAVEGPAQDIAKANGEAAPGGMAPVRPSAWRRASARCRWSSRRWPPPPSWRPPRSRVPRRGWSSCTRWR